MMRTLLVLTYTAPFSSMARRVYAGTGSAVPPLFGDVLKERTPAQRLQSREIYRLGARHFVKRRGDGIIRNRNGESAALPHGTEDQKVADGLGHADARGDGVRV